MTNLKTALALCALMSLAACGGSDTKADPAQSAPTLTSTTGVVAPASATPIPKPKPTPLTRQQAAAAYTKLIKPSNDLLAVPMCSAAEDFFISGGEWPPDNQPEWPAAEKVLRACYLRSTPVMAASIAAMQNTLWPAEAREDMDDLISLDQAVLHCMRIGTKAKTYEAMQKVFQCTPEDDGSADRVRARFGLPKRAS